MTSSSTNSSASFRSEVEKIVASGREIRSRLSAVVAQAAEKAQQTGQGLASLMQDVLEGAREGLQKSVPSAPDDALRQVVDALGDGFSQAALAARLAVEEAASGGRQFAQEDLVRLRDDLQAINSLFTESISRTLARGQALTSTELSNILAHAGTVKERLGPVIGTVLGAIRRDPILLGKESVQAGVGAGRHAAGALFEALGGMLERAGKQLRQQGNDK